VEAKDRLIADVRKGNIELLQQNHILEMHNNKLSDELMWMYRSRDPHLATAHRLLLRTTPTTSRPS
jgi:hypothetical protein